MTLSLEPLDSKALPLIVTVPPRSTVSSLLALQNAQVPIVSKPSGRVSEVSEERRKASSPIERRDAGRVTVTRPDSVNARFAISVVPSITVYVPPEFFAVGYRIRREWSLEYRTPSTLS